MNVYDVIALTIQSNDGVIDNRTTLQKLVYFASVKVPNVEIKPYRHYFYGPFSREVAAAVEEMSAFSYLNEVAYSGFYESYTYELTKKGTQYATQVSMANSAEFKQISDIVSTCKNFCKLKPNPLSFAAKAYYILANTEEGRKGTYTKADVQRVAENFDWNISGEDVEIGISLLKELELVKVS